MSLSKVGSMLCPSQFLRSILSKNSSQCRSFQSSTFLCGIKWRLEKGLHINPTSYGPLTTLPDYTFTDGKIVPLGANMRRKLMKQKQYSERIVKLCKELDFAVERHHSLQIEEKEFRQQIIDNKFKTKGKVVLE